MPPTTEAKDSRRSSRDRSAAERLSVGADRDRQGSRAGPSRCASAEEVLAHDQATPIRRAPGTLPNASSCDRAISFKVRSFSRGYLLFDSFGVTCFSCSATHEDRPAHAHPPARLARPRCEIRLRRVFFAPTLQNPVVAEG